MDLRQSLLYNINKQSTLNKDYQCGELNNLDYCLFKNLIVKQAPQKYREKCYLYLGAETDMLSWCTANTINLMYTLNLPEKRILSFCSKTKYGSGCSFCRAFGANYSKKIFSTSIMESE